MEKLNDERFTRGVESLIEPMDVSHLLFLQELRRMLPVALPPVGVTSPNRKTAMFTTNAKGEVFLDFKEDRTDRQLSLKGRIDNGTIRSLDESLWLMGNTSIGHSKELSSGDDAPLP